MYKNKYKIQKNNYIKYIIGGNTEKKSELSYNVIKKKIQESLNTKHQSKFLKFEKSEIKLGSSYMDFIGEVKQLVEVKNNIKCNEVKNNEYKCHLNIELFNEQIEDYSFLIYYTIHKSLSPQFNDENIYSINDENRIRKEVNGILLNRYIRKSKFEHNHDIKYDKIHFFGTIYKIDQTDNSNKLEGIIFEMDKYCIFIGTAKYIDDNDDKKIIYIYGTKYEFKDNTFTKYEKVTFGHWKNNIFDEYSDFDNDNQYQTYIKKISGKEVFTIKSAKNETTDKTMEEITDVEITSTNEENIKEKLIVQNLYHHYEVKNYEDASSYKLYCDELKEIRRGKKKLEFENSTGKKKLITSIIQDKFVDIFSLVTIK